MKILVRYPSLFKDAVGKDEELIDFPFVHVGSLIDLLSQKYPKLKKLIFDAKTKRLICVIIVNAKIVSPEELPRESLREGDQVALLYPVAGG